LDGLLVDDIGEEELWAISVVVCMERGIGCHCSMAVVGANQTMSAK
jgi:hypothetical protein